MATPSVSPIDCCPTSTETSSTSSASRSSGRTRSTCRGPAAPLAAPSVLRPRPSSRNLLPFSFFREERFAFGHHYFRPHETHHSPSRRFYHNELFRVPLYEIIPLEAVVGTCCVLDLYTYCKGKWLGLLEERSVLSPSCRCPRLSPRSSGKALSKTSSDASENCAGTQRYFFFIILAFFNTVYLALLVLVGGWSFTHPFHGP